MESDSMVLPAFSSFEEKRDYVEGLWREVGSRRLTEGNACYPREEVCRLEWAGEVPLLRFAPFDQFPFVNGAFSTRFGGVSEGCLGEMNLGFSRGDSPDVVARNFRIFCRAMGVNSEKLVLSDQVHDTRIQRVAGEDGCGEEIRKRLLGIDGLCTDVPGMCLATSYADCVPLLFVDGEHRAIASSHAGWRGTAAKMGARTVEEMGACFGSRPEALVAVIGPSICRDCYEVDGEVVSAFEKSYGREEMAEIVYPGRRPGKYQLDLWAANFLALKEAGIPPERIHVSGICTCCHPMLFYSHRASRGNRGNLNAFLAITVPSAGRQ